MVDYTPLILSLIFLLGACNVSDAEPILQNTNNQSAASSNNNTPSNTSNNSTNNRSTTNNKSASYSNNKTTTNTSGNCICADGEICNDAGECVECRSDEDCPDKDLCDQRPNHSNSCSPAQERSRGQCESCVSDSHCKKGHACVEEVYKDISVGFYCMRMPGVKSCTKPYAVSNYDISIGENKGTFCGLKVSTCAALNQEASYCGSMPVGKGDADRTQCAQGAVCEKVSLSWRCGILCESTADCPAKLKCTGNDPVSTCNKITL